MALKALRAFVNGGHAVFNIDGYTSALPYALCMIGCSVLRPFTKGTHPHTERHFISAYVTVLQGNLPIVLINRLVVHALYLRKLCTSCQYGADAPHGKCA